MKRLTPKCKKRLILRARNEAKRHRGRLAAGVGQRREAAFQRFFEIRQTLPDPQIDYNCRPGHCTIIPPENFDLVGNYDQTLAFIMDMRALFYAKTVQSPDGKRQLRTFADFAKIQSIEPAAGLILAAEVDRWRISTGKQPRSHDRDWQPAVRRFFAQAGLFELLGIQPQLGHDEFDENLPIETLPFVRGFSVFGELGSKLRDGLEQLCGASIGPRKIVYDAIAEAIANTRHAYPPGISIWPSKLAGRWWASGSWRSDVNTVSVQLYDQGVGIPATLPRSEHWSDVIRLAGLGERMHPERNHDRLIEAALDVGRTSTGQQGRGKGLAEMAAWIDRRGSGFLRITSGRGSVTYRPGGRKAGLQRRTAFPGTLVEWEVKLDD